MKVYTVADIGQQIKDVRKKRGLTQRQLADACRCGTRFISDLENGKPTVELEKTMRLAQALGIDFELTRR